MVSNRIITLITRSASLIFSIFGLLDNFEVFNGLFLTNLLAYYTVLSNILIIGLFAFLVVRTIIDIKKNGIHGSSSYAPRFEMVCVINILLTFIVYWTMLVPESGNTGLWSFSNLAVHAITPILCFIDYFIYTKAHHLKYRDVYYTLLFPLAYFVITSIAGACGAVFRIDVAGAPVHYPYFFFDYDRTGGMVAVYVLAVSVFLIGFAHFLYFIDKKWNKTTKKHQTKQ